MTWQSLAGRRLRDDANGGGDPDNDDREPNPNVVNRLYGWKGQIWPRLSISVYVRRADLMNHYGSDRVVISTSFKEAPGHWWGDCTIKGEGYWTSGDIPPELLTDLTDMIKQAQEIVAEPMRWRARDYGGFAQGGFGPDGGPTVIGTREFPDIKTTTDQENYHEGVKRHQATLDAWLDQLYAKGLPVPPPGSRPKDA